jgi:hypothetical protein
MTFKDKDEQKKYMRELMRKRRGKQVVIPSVIPIEPVVIPVIPNLETEFYISLSKLKNINRPFILWSSSIRLLNKEFLEDYSAYEKHKQSP